MKKKLWIVVLIAVLLIVVLMRVSVEFVYVNPLVNKSVFSHISKTVKLVNEGLDYALNACNMNDMHMKISFKNAYGSGFLKENSIPNDLDYSIGVHLGSYKYDGTNAEEIAADMIDKISLFQNQYYDYVEKFQKDKFYSNVSSLNSVMNMGKKRKQNIKAVSSSIDKVFEGKEYIIYTRKRVDNDKYIDIPFILKPSEILIEDFDPITLYTDQISYSINDAVFLRELTIVADYSVDIENTVTKEKKTVEIVAESFTGQRLQLSRRFFVPIVFFGEDSAKYLNELSYLKNDDEYLEYRLFNYKRHLQEIQNLNEFNDRPVKMLKRVLQCADIIYPVLDEDTRKNISSKISENLSNKDVQLLNTYHTALGNLIQITNLPNVYARAYDDGKIKTIIDVMDNSLIELKSRGNLDKRDIDKLMDFDNEIRKKLGGIRSESELYNYNTELVNKTGDTAFPIIINLFNKTIKHKDDIKAYAEYFVNIFERAGFHKVDIYWIDKDTMGIIKDDFTKNINPNELRKMALENKLADVNYKLTDKKDINLFTARYSVYVRYNPTNEEEKNWQVMKSKLLKDKKNFNIKRRIVF